MKFYIAGKYAHRKLLGLKRDELIKLGNEVTHDWMSYELPKRTHKTMGMYAHNDIRGVTNADVVIFVMDDDSYAYRGTFTELGAALALRKPIIMYTPEGTQYCKTNVFWHHPSIHHHQTWKGVLKEVDILSTRDFVDF